MRIIQKLSSHYEERKNGAKPSFLILHYTETKSIRQAENYFLNVTQRQDGAKVSAHYMVGRDGGIRQYVDEDRRAWHAGQSYWEGVTDINSHSIGIEIVNPGPTYGYIPFAEKQMRSVTALCRDILSRHDIPSHRVLGHSDVAPGRKIDPGELFDWKRLAENGIGLWPAPLREDFERAVNIREALAAYGYNPAIDLKTLVTEFQRHFQPEIFRTPKKVGIEDAETAARLSCLLRMKG